MEEEADVISMSFGGDGIGGLGDPVKAAYEDGVLLVAAAGNDGNSNYGFPASADEAMSVAAVDRNKNRAGFSQYNDQVEISGPGVDIKSTLPNNKYGDKRGTSMAAPHVAGVAALVWSYFPRCSNRQIRVALDFSAKIIDANCNNEYGFGIVNALNAYKLIRDYGGNDCSGIPSGQPHRGCNVIDTVSVVLMEHLFLSKSLGIIFSHSAT